MIGFSVVTKFNTDLCRIACYLRPWLSFVLVHSCDVIAGQWLCQRDRLLVATNSGRLQWPRTRRHKSWKWLVGSHTGDWGGVLTYGLVTVIAAFWLFGSSIYMVLYNIAASWCQTRLWSSLEMRVHFYGAPLVHCSRVPIGFRYHDIWDVCLTNTIMW